MDPKKPAKPARIQRKMFCGHTLRERNNYKREVNICDG